mgnify:CR=1 FL=1
MPEKLLSNVKAEFNALVSQWDATFVFVTNENCNCSECPYMKKNSLEKLRDSLLRLEPGRGLPQHKHAGYEYTVCLQGGYTDETGNYGVGDFAVGPGEHRHEPIADPGEPCIALIVVEKPIVLTGPWGRFFNPLVKRGLI